MLNYVQYSNDSNSNYFINRNNPNGCLTVKCVLGVVDSAKKAKTTKAGGLLYGKGKYPQYFAPFMQE